MFVYIIHFVHVCCTHGVCCKECRIEEKYVQCNHCAQTTLSIVLLITVVLLAIQCSASDAHMTSPSRVQLALLSV